MKIYLTVLSDTHQSHSSFQVVGITTSEKTASSHYNKTVKAHDSNDESVSLYSVEQYYDIESDLWNEATKIKNSDEQ